MIFLKNNLQFERSSIACGVYMRLVFTVLLLLASVCRCACSQVWHQREGGGPPLKHTQMCSFWAFPQLAAAAGKQVLYCFQNLIGQT